MRTLLLSMLAILSLLPSTRSGEEPKIVNIINFVREIEPRVEGGIEDELFETTSRQVKLLEQYGLPGTFLLQYDALINPAYQILFKEEASAENEIGAWWEITQPHVEAAGLRWRGRFPWDWHANVGFATGYTPEEREILVDVYMDKFKSVFGYYPKSVGSWFIDAHTLRYMYEKYGITASCNCKDQVGTDGYTMWGGYWNQAYYPSILNAYMPAQTEDMQIPVPIFRMLGSDPVYQYDNGLGTEIQGVVTLEPVYTGSSGGGGIRQWIEWYLSMIVKGECLTFNYIQAGQENSFTWRRMKDGLLIQIPLIKEMSDDGRLKVMTLGESGDWFRKRFRLTPPSSVVAEDDFLHSGKRSIWYNSRFWRANLYWNGDSFRFRDIHLFDQNIESDYLTKAGKSTKCVFSTLPVVDGFLWSTESHLAGLRLVSEGKEVPVSAPVVSKRGHRTLVVKSYTPTGKLKIVLGEKGMTVSIRKSSADWSLEFSSAPGKELPFKEAEPKKLSAEFNGYPYHVSLGRGKFSFCSDSGQWRIVPEGGSISLKCVCARNGK